MEDLLLPTHLVFLAIILGGYVIPSIVAVNRRCKSISGIIIINLLLGWTLVGWVVALAWAASGEQAPKTEIAEISKPISATIRKNASPGFSYNFAKALGSVFHFHR